MSDPYLHSDPAYTRATAPRDQLAAYLYVRSLRNAYLRAHASALSRFVWRQIRQRFRASPQVTGGRGPFEPFLPLEPGSAQKEGRK